MYTLYGISPRSSGALPITYIFLYGKWPLSYWISPSGENNMRGLVKLLSPTSQKVLYLSPHSRLHPPSFKSPSFPLLFFLNHRILEVSLIFFLGIPDFVNNLLVQESYTMASTVGQVNYSYFIFS
jgi:hypothetical protein